MSLPALVLLLFVALTAIVAVRVQGQCVDAAMQAARAAARGEPGEVAGLRVAPAGASVVVETDVETATARVVVRVRPLGGGPGFTVQASARSPPSNRESADGAGLRRWSGP
jgi:hypothetical protein